MEEIPDEQAGGLSLSSLISIESLVQKVDNVYHFLCIILLI
jgi:hypothetical protein